MNPQKFIKGAVFGGNTVHGDSTTDDSAAFAAAASAGDVSVAAGGYWINGTVSIPSGRHIQCASGAYFINTSSGDQMFAMSGSGSMFYCGFRGPNYNISAKPVYSGSFVTRSTDLELVGNDFNGIDGFIGAVYVGNGGNNAIIEYNTFEHCDYYAVQTGGGNNITETHNTLNDCSLGPECDDTGTTSCSGLVDSNSLTFTYGAGCCGGNGCDGMNGLTTGDNPTPFNYSGWTISNNSIGGTCGSYYEVDDGQPAGDMPTLINNSCTGGCQATNYNAGC